ncbi:MAG: MFS transporter, partial [Gammaproteobacteria bacterium]|nr:MFS transporter [Gammaproteobacteria bacterium]
VPVIPMALRGLWGSYFSRMDKKITKGTRKFWDPIFVAATEPVEPEKVSASQLEQIVKDLRGALQ